MRRLLNPFYKSVIFKENQYGIFFKDISKFDMQNPVIGSIPSEIESGKLTEKSLKRFFSKAPNSKDIELNQELQRLKE